MPKRHYKLDAEPGRYEVHGSSASGILGALYTGRSVDVEGGFRDAKNWFDNYETSGGENLPLERPATSIRSSRAIEYVQCTALPWAVLQQPSEIIPGLWSTPTNPCTSGTIQRGGRSSPLPLLIRKRREKRTRHATGRLHALDAAISDLT
jgi:hypothetical protein